MSDRSKIKILISCHKPVAYPKSDLFLPVHVGAEGKMPLAGMQPDNDGDNISSRNFTYCELTAQYWAWKNLDADYVGQCHYRRYFCFDGEKHKANDHKQIEVECLSPYSIKKYHLADEERIRSVVETHDVVTAPYWNVLGSVTLEGTKKTIRGHMVGYGLMTDADVDELIRICREKQPEYAEELVRYLNGSKYLGYNCFIMKRELFDRLCEFEFSILEEFDKNFSYDNMTTTRKRICGYFGEILYSVFINRLKKTDKCSIAHVPLVFFEKTPARFDVSPASDKVNIFWRYPEASPAKLSVAVRSLAEAINPSSSYRLTIIHDPNLNESEFKNLTRGLPENLELIQGTFQTLDAGSYEGSVTDSELQILLPFLLPRIVSEKDGCAKGRVLWIEGCAFFIGDPEKILRETDGSAFYALPGVSLEKEFNKPFNRNYLARYLEVAGGRNMLDPAAMVIDLERALCLTNALDPLTAYQEISEEFGNNPAEILNSSLAGYWAYKRRRGSGRDTFSMPLEVQVARSVLLTRYHSETLSYCLAYPVLSEGDTLIWANEDTAKKWKAAEPSGILAFKPESNPLVDPSNPYCSLFWSLARRSPAYESLLMPLVEMGSPTLKDRMLPPYSRRRRFLGRVNGLLHKLI